MSAHTCSVSALMQNMLFEHHRTKTPPNNRSTASGDREALKKGRFHWAESIVSRIPQTLGETGRIPERGTSFAPVRGAGADADL